MNAHNRPLPEWFNRIRSRQITLPRFQRSGVGVWGHKQVSGLLTTVLRGLPSGAALILEVGDKPKFESRPMAGAPESGERVVEQLLDGHDSLHNALGVIEPVHAEQQMLGTHAERAQQIVAREADVRTAEIFFHAIGL